MQSIFDFAVHFRVFDENLALKFNIFNCVCENHCSHSSTDEKIALLSSLQLESTQQFICPDKDTSFDTVKALFQNTLKS